jgi:hypothetical protein
MGLSEIGRHFSISPQRVHQILVWRGVLPGAESEAV